MSVQGCAVSSALLQGCNATAGGDRGQMAPSDSRRAQANTDLQWKALGSRSRLPGDAQHGPAASRPLRSCSRLGGIRTSGSFGVWSG